MPKSLQQAESGHKRMLWIFLHCGRSTGALPHTGHSILKARGAAFVGIHDALSMQLEWPVSEGTRRCHDARGAGAIFLAFLQIVAYASQKSAIAGYNLRNLFFLKIYWIWHPSHG